MSTLRVLAFLFPLFSLCCVSVEAAPTRKPLAALEVEEYEDPPALVWRTETSPRKISPHGNFTSYQVNVGASGQNIAGDAANEPSICVDPTNRNRMAIGWRQFNTVGLEFPPRRLGLDQQRRPHLDVSRSAQNSVFRSDPVLLADDTGNSFT